MTILDKLRSWFGASKAAPPTLEQLAEAFVAELNRRGATAIEPNLGMSEIRYSLDGQQIVTYLGNLLGEYQAAPRERRPAVLTRFLDGMSAALGSELPDTFAEARAQLMPVVRTRDDMGIAALSVARMSRGDADEKPQPHTAHRPLVGELVVALVCDMPDAMQYVNDELLEKWQVDFDTALEEALHNLRGLPEAGGWHELAPGVWSGEWGDAYESSRLLLPDLIHRLGVPEPVALPPLRNALLVCSARSDAALQAMHEMAAAAVDAPNARWLSFEPLRLGDDGRWTPLAPLPLHLQQAFHDLMLRNAMGSHQAQKELLEDLAQREGDAPFVASYQLLRKGRDDGKDSAPLFSYAVWGEGVDTLLPEAELIAFVREHQGDDHFMVRWDDVQALAGALLEPAGTMTPPRHRARQFPPPELLAELRERAVVL